MVSNGDIMLLSSIFVFAGVVLYILISIQKNGFKKERFYTNNTSLCGDVDSYYKRCTETCVTHPITQHQTCSISKCTRAPSNVPIDACVIDFMGGNCMKKKELDSSIYTKTFLILTLSTYENIYFSVFKRINLEEELTPIREKTLAIYKEGINLIGYKLRLKKNNNTVLNTPYTITRISVPKGYSVFFELVNKDNSFIKITPVFSGVDIKLPEPIVIDPNIYRKVSIKLIPSSSNF